MRTRHLLFVAAALTACSRPSPSPEDPRKSTPGFGSMNLVGQVFNGDCQVSSEHVPRSFQDTMTFTDGSLDRSHLDFDGVTCDSIKKRDSYSYHYDNPQHQDHGDLPSWETIDYTIQDIKLTLFTDTVVAEFNQLKHFDIADWQINQPRSINGHGYSTSFTPMAERGMAWSNTMRIDHDTLYVARYQNGIATSEKSKVFHRQ